MAVETKRLEALEKITGKSIFSGDIKLPRMLTGKILRSKVPHAIIKNINISKALAVPGVKSIITGMDFPDVKFGFVIQDETVMARNKIRYIGEAVAAVAAENEQAANKALELIELEIEELQPVLNFTQATAKDAPLIHEDLKNYRSKISLKQYGNVCLHTRIERGDVEQAFEKSDEIFEDTYFMPVVHHAPLEPRAVVAMQDANNKLIVWCSTQAPFSFRAGIASTLNLSMSDIRVIGARVGGAFGAKVMISIEPIASLLAIKSKQPVKIEMSREDDFLAGSPRHSMEIKLKTGVKKDGTIIARQAHLKVDTGAYSYFGPNTTSQAALLVTGPYNIPNLLIEGICAYTNKISCGPCRGPGAPQAHFAAETQMDKIARKLGINHIEIRKKNALKENDLSATGQVLTDDGYQKVLKQLEKSINDHLSILPKKSRGKHRGIGIAGCFWGMSGYSSSATVRVNEDGSATLFTGATETGAGSDTTFALLVSGELGIPLECIRVISGDTDATPYDHGAIGSRTTQAMGVAVTKAIADVKNQLLKVAEKKLNVEQEKLVFRNGKIIDKNNPQNFLFISTATSISTKESSGPVVATGNNITPNPPFNDNEVDSHTVTSKPFFVFGAQAVAVEVDELTGKIDVLKVVAVHNVGKAIFIPGIEGQIQGGVTMGLGYALSEEVIFSEGKPLNNSFLDYRIPTMLDTPEIIPIIVEKDNAKIPEDIRGIGEPVTIPTAAAVANALYDAVKVRINELPMKPEKVYWALQQTLKTNI